MYNNIHIKLINDREGFESLEKEWDAIYKKSHFATIFTSWTWMYTWWEVFQDQFKRELFILCLYDNGQIVGIAPFQLVKSFPKSLIQGKTLQFIGTGSAAKDNIVSEYLDFIVLPDYEFMFCNEVKKFLNKHRKKWNFAEFEFLLNGALIFNCFTEDNKYILSNTIEYGVRFTIPNLNSFEDFLNITNKRWTKMYEKKSIRLLKKGDVKIESTASIESVEPALDLLAKMHYERWKDRTDVNIFKSKRFYEFHKKILNQWVLQSKAYIKILLVNNKPIAAYYAFEDKGIIHYYQSGFYNEYSKLSPLFLLIFSEIEASIKGKKVFDFMFDENPESYKKHQYSAKAQKMYKLKCSSSRVRLTIYYLVKNTRLILLELKGKKIVKHFSFNKFKKLLEKG